MNIKSLELIGFKSFHNKTKVEFSEGINAIVGPNGCGKSNIIDAIRWVLGEQNPRMLRADSMEELISNGTDVLKPYGMAEVSMLVNNLPNLAFEEVNIKRRLYRSGESEYYINGVKSRLKDVTELFLDTGAGARSYSIIGQGKVEEFIIAKPQEKRQLIEEVAGIVKYKTRRKETQSRIETTQEHLSRISDIKSEIVKQMKNLSRQAEDAEKYKRLNSEIATLEINILDLRSSEIETKRNDLLKTKSQIDQKVAELKEQRENKTKILSEKEIKDSDIDGTINELEEKIHSVETVINEKKNFIEYASKQQESIDEFINRLDKEIELLQKEIDQTNNAINEKREYLNQSESTKQKIAEELKTKTNELDQLRSESANNKMELEQSKKVFFEILDNYSSVKGTAAAISKELEEIRIRKSKIEKEKMDLNQQSDQLSISLNSLKNNLQNLKDENIGLEDRKVKQVNLYKTKKADCKNLSELANNIKEKINETSSKLDVLKKIQDSYEWLPEVTRNFILNKSFNGIIGIISDFITVPKQYEKALEAALSEKTNWVAVRSSDEAIEAINKLRDSCKGRSTFIPLHNENSFDTAKVSADGQYSRVTDLITVKGIDPDIIGSILKDIFVVPTIKDAIEAKAKPNAPSVSYTTLEGDFIDASGAITGGVASGGVFEKRREIEELEKNLEKLNSEHQYTSGETEKFSHEINDIEVQIRDIDSLLKKNEIKVVELEKDIANTTSIINENEKNILRKNNDIEELDKLIKDRENKATEYDTTLKNLEKDKEEFDLRFNKFEEIVRNYENREKLIENHITELKVKAASVDETQKSTHREISNLIERTRLSSLKIDREKEEIKSKDREKTNLLDRGKVTAKEIETLNNEFHTIREELLNIKAEKQRAKESISIDRESLTKTDQELIELQDSASSYEVKLKSMDIELENIHEKTQTISKEKKLKDHKNTNTTDEKLSLDEMIKKNEKLKGTLESYGLVNLLAPEEYKKLEERHDFLDKQTKDIEAALESLKKAINKIDKESTTRFQQTFEQINDKFGEIVSKLFQGGQGKLIITDPDHLLETGIEVMVRPRGKKFQSMNLLSGGEKAVSAIALIISACLIKPVPFLLLDEIDAPLDEFNTIRFSKLTKEIANASQVIVVTHNKRTMLEVDTLTGITTDRSAVSKVVSAELSVA